MRWLVIALLVVVLATAAGTAWLLLASLPDDADRVSVAGLGAPVTVRYDARRVPFVTADTLEDVLFAEGWLHARERLWQMELMRRAGHGRLAQALGRSTLETDRALWRAGVPELARTLAANAGADLQRRVDAYVSGINAALDALAVRPPEFLLTGIEPVPWSQEDVFAVGALMAFQSSNNMANELLRLQLATALDPDRFAAFLPDEAADDEFPYVLPGPGSASAWERRRDPGRTTYASAELRAAELALSTAGRGLLRAGEALVSLDAALLPSFALGSNGWVVAPRRTESGHALFAFDSHDDLALPNLFYEVHLFFDGHRQIRGWSVAGLPGVINGYNRRLAWGLTNIGDTQDLFVEERHPDDPLRFRGPDGWYRADTTTVEIPVAGTPAPERLEIVRTRHGPLIHDDPPLALRWTGHDPQGLGMDGFFAMALAEDAATFTAALDRVAVPVANVTWADVEGNIGFRTMGRLPVRISGRGLVPAAGAGADAGWRGYVPVAALPQSRNPPAGWIAAANARVAADETPLVSADNAPGYRMRRLRQRLGTGRLSIDDMQRLQMDWYNAQAALLLPALISAAGHERFSPAAAAALRQLAAWQENPYNDPDAAGPLIYEHFYLALAQELFAGALPGDLYERLMRNNYVLNHALDRVILDPASLWWQGRHRERVGRAFEAAVAGVMERAGKAPAAWRWGDVQSVVMRHELDAAVPVAGRLLSRGPYAWGGGPTTVGRARYRYHQPFIARAGATVRVVAEMREPIAAYAIMPGGQSGHPASRHYADQIPGWLAGELTPISSDRQPDHAALTELVPAATTTTAIP